MCVSNRASFWVLKLVYELSPAMAGSGRWGIFSRAVGVAEMVAPRIFVVRVYC